MAGRKKVGKKIANVRDRKFVQGVAQGKTDYRAALDAAFPPSMAKNTAAKIWSKPEVQEYFRSLMRAAAPPKRIVDKISEHIDAKSVHTRVRRKMGPPSADRARVVLEQIEERTETVDAGVSLRAIELAMQAAEYVPRKDEVPTVGSLTQIQLISEDAIIKKLLGTLDA